MEWKEEDQLDDHSESENEEAAEESDSNSSNDNDDDDAVEDRVNIRNLIRF